MPRRAFRVRQTQVVVEKPEIDPGSLGNFEIVGVIHRA